MFKSFVVVFMSRRVLIGILLYTMIFVKVALPQALVIASDLPKLSSNKSVNKCSPNAFVSGPTKWIYTYSRDEGSQWLRAQLSIRGSHDNEAWTIELSDKNGVVEQIIHSDQITAAAKPQMWTDLLVGSTFTLKVMSTANLDGLSFCLDSINFPQDNLEDKSLIGNIDDRQDLVLAFGLASRYYKYGRSVALIRFQDTLNGNGSESNCTGVLISPTLVATNNHCIGSQSSIDTATITFGYETNGQPSPPLKVIALAATNVNLDYSLLSIPTVNYPFAKISTKDLARATKLILIQHPSALPKKIAVKKCRVEEVRALGRETDFFHLCDSSGGSSGSPVMEESTGVVFGLHHLGVSDPKTKDFHNLAVYFSEIFKDLKTRYPDLYRQFLQQRPDIVVSQETHGLGSYISSGLDSEGGSPKHETLGVVNKVK
jgi:hypothetical protein